MKALKIIGKIFAWIIAIIIILFGVLYTALEKEWQAVLFIIAGLSIVPPIVGLCKNKLKSKIFIHIIAFFVFTITPVIILSSIQQTRNTTPTPIKSSVVTTPRADIINDEPEQTIITESLLNTENEEITISFIYGDRTGLYTGTMLNDQPSGYGNFVYSTDEGIEWSYLGFFDNGQFNGTGETIWETGARREGTYKNGSLVNGRIYSADGTLLFEGELGEQEEHTEEFIHFLHNAEFPDELVQLSSYDRNLTVHFIDVGQADSILILLPNGENMLIDGGDTGNAKTIMDYMKKHNVTSIDYLVASHPHADHIGGLPAIIDAMDISNIYMPRVSHTTLTFERLLTSIQNKGLQIDQAIDGVSILAMPELAIDILGPVREDYKDHNDHSAVVKLTYRNISFLFMGDAEGASESHISGNISADVLKVGHHGSSTSTSDSFLRKVKPSYAVICVGKNSYGHPTDDVLFRLNNADVEVYRTDMVGTIVFTSDGENIIIDKSPSQYQPPATPSPTPAPTPTPTPNPSPTPAPTPTPTPPPGNSGSDDIVVFITRTGERYHEDGCRHLSRSKIESTLSAAKKQGLTACGTCKPPS